MRPGPDQMLLDSQLWWRNLHIPQTHYIKHTVCKCHFLQQLETIFLRFASVCMIEKTQLNEKQKKWWGRACCALAWVQVSGCRCNLIWIRMLWLRGIESRWIRKEGTTNMQTEQLETGDQRGAGGRYISLPDRNTADSTSNGKEIHPTFTYALPIPPY